MSNTPNVPNPLPAEINLTPEAITVERANSNGKTCQLIDNTGTIAQSMLDELLTQLIQDKQFGINAISSTDGVLNIDKPRLSHIQIDESLYRLILFRYQAVIENF